MTGRSRPSSEISPTKALPANGRSPPQPAARIPSRMGRSYSGPLFLVSAGARFTTSTPAGKVYPKLPMALCTRSRLSFTAVSGSPTISNRGSPRRQSTSTVTG